MARSSASARRPTGRSTLNADPFMNFMKTTISIRDLFRCLCVALAVMLTLAVLARAEEPAPAPAATTEEKSAPPQSAVPAETEKSELRHLDSPAAEKADAPASDENEKAEDDRPAKPGHKIRGYTIGVTRGNHGD